MVGGSCSSNAQQQPAWALLGRGLRMSIMATRMHRAETFQHSEAWLRCGFDGAVSLPTHAVLEV